MYGSDDVIVSLQCTQSFSDDSNRDGGQEEGEGDSEDVCQFSVPDVSISTFLDDVGNTTSQILENRENCPLVSHQAVRSVRV